jgi:CheY-like chemotaxis protein
MGKKILVCDDEPGIQAALRAFLEEKGYEVSIASHGYEAIDAVMKEDFDLILLDINMPRLDGLDALGLMRFTERNIPPVIVVSALGDKKNVLKAIGFAADDFIRKPFDLHDLGRRIEQQLLVLDFQTLHEVLEKLPAKAATIPDELKQMIIPTWVSYPSLYRGLEVCVFMNPKAGVKNPLSLTYEQCLTELVVMAHYKTGWRPIWPKTRIEGKGQAEKKQSVG